MAKKIIILNHGDVEKYLHGFAGDDRQLADDLYQALGSFLAYRPENLREADPETVKNSKNVALQINRDMLGMKFCEFDPTLDPELDGKISNIVALLKTTRQVERDWRGPDSEREETPYMLRSEFIQAAIGKSQQQTLPVTFSQAAQPARTKPAAKQEVKEPGPEEKAEKPAARKAEKKNTPQEPQLPLEVIASFSDGWQVKRFMTYKYLQDANHEMGNCLGNYLDKEKMMNAENVYYGLFDKEDNCQAMIEQETRHGRYHYVMQCRTKDGELPTLEQYEYITDFLASKGYNIDNLENTGLLKRTDKTYYCLFNIPEKSQYYSWISSDSERLKDLGGLQHAGALIFKGAKNLESIGPLETSRDLNLNGCQKVTTLGKLREVQGDLDIRGTGITEIPSSLVKVKGKIHTDAGSFRWLSSARKALKSYHAKSKPKDSPKPIPGPGGSFYYSP